MMHTIRVNEIITLYSFIIYEVTYQHLYNLETNSFSHDLLPINESTCNVSNTLGPVEHMSSDTSTLSSQ